RFVDHYGGNDSACQAYHHEIAATIDSARTEIHRAAEISNNLRAFANAYLGGRSLIDLNPVVNVCVLQVEDRAQRRKIAVHQELAPSKVSVHCDAAVLTVALMNVLENACDAARSNVWVSTVTAANTPQPGRRNGENEKVSITVQDDGH